MTKTITWHLPQISGEVSRIQEIVRSFTDSFIFTKVFLRAEKTATLEPLSEEIWKALHSTESFQIHKGDWEKVRQLTQDPNYDWETIKCMMEACSEVDAPVILKWRNEYHVVRCDTCLMVSRALGVIPMVAVIQM